MQKNKSDQFEFQYVECRDVQILIDEVSKYIKNRKSIDEIKRAYYYAEDKHKEQKRKSGDPFIIHPLSTAYYLAQWRMGPKTIIAGLLHDVIEDTPVTFDEIEELWGTDVADIVEAVTKVSFFTKENREQMKANYLRKLFLSMIRDIRVIIVKIADRMHNLLTLQYMKPEKQKIIAKETLEIYSTIAHRIGMKNAKSLLEDYSFEFLDPEAYEKIVKLLEEDKETRNKIIDETIDTIKNVLTLKGFKNVAVYGRSKTIYSIYRKMHQFGKHFSDIHDILAVRVITSSVQECYAALGEIHQLYTPLSGRFKDYIATPKNNLYQSLHTTLANKNGTIFEVQIRTKEMDDIAEHGAAAHWKYKEGEKNIDVSEKQKEIDEKVDMFTRLMNLEKLASEGADIDYQQEQIATNFGEEIEETFKSDYLAPTIYILTPEGQVITLPFGSTVLDFAYKIHTELGNKTTGAKINGVFSPYNTILNSGEMVEIQTSNEVHPDETWLRFVRTNTAKKAIETYIIQKRKKEKEKEIVTNQKIIRNTKREIDRYIIANNLKWQVNGLEDIQKKIQVLDFKNIDEFLLSVGNGDFSIPEAVDIVYLAKELKDLEKINEIKTRKYRSNAGRDDLKINGMEKVSCTLGTCCYPIPSESIVAFMSKTKGIQVHKDDCINILNIKKTKSLLPAEWILKKTFDKKYKVKLRLKTMDRPGVLLDIVSILNQKRVNILEAKLITDFDEVIGKGSFIIDVNNYENFKQILQNIAEIPGVTEVLRAISSDNKFN